MRLTVTNWDRHFENNRTRVLQTTNWVPVPNKQDGDGYTALVEHPDGAAHLGAWLAIIEVASKCAERGVLIRSTGEPHDYESLSRISRLPPDVFEAAIPRLVTIGWLTDHDAPPPERKAKTPQNVTKAQAGAVEAQASAVKAQASAGSSDSRDLEESDCANTNDSSGRHLDVTKAQAGAVEAHPSAALTRAWNGMEWNGREGNGKGEGGGCAAAAESGRARALEPEDPVPKHSPPLTPDAVRELWNDLAAKPLPRCSRLTPRRLTALRARIRDHPRARDWVAAIEAVNASAFCQGAKGWLADFDYLLRPDTLTKALERSGVFTPDGRAAPGAFQVQTVSPEQGW